MLWIKALHVISIIAWMAGMLYLPRLFVYHAGAERGSVQSETFKIMERRLYRGIITPAMIAAWIFGLLLAVWFGLADWSSLWWWTKFVLVIAMSGLQGLYGRHLRDFAADKNTRPARYFRVLNEVPTLMMVAIVVAVIVKPF